MMVAKKLARSYTPHGRQELKAVICKRPSLASSRCIWHQTTAVTCKQKKKQSNPRVNEERQLHNESTQHASNSATVHRKALSLPKEHSLCLCSTQKLHLHTNEFIKHHMGTDQMQHQV